jgi:hypothetical protein
MSPILEFGTTAMRLAIRAPREFWLGLVYLTFGAGGLWFAQDYPMGTAGRMGPGYMPTAVCLLLILFAVISFARSVQLTGEPVGALALKPLLLVLAGVIAFALLAEPLGLIGAIIALVMLSAAGSPEFRLHWAPMLGLVGLIVFCGAVFVWGLGVPLPLLGTWFGPWFGY